jgi:hypothetical protein
VFNIHQPKPTKLRKLRLYKITQVQALRPRDPGRRVNSCNWFIQPVNDGIFDPQLEFSVTKCGSICMDVLIPKTTDTGRL